MWREVLYIGDFLPGWERLLSSGLVAVIVGLLYVGL